MVPSTWYVGCSICVTRYCNAKLERSYAQTIPPLEPLIFDESERFIRDIKSDLARAVPGKVTRGVGNVRIKRQQPEPAVQVTGLDGQFEFYVLPGLLCYHRHLPGLDLVGAPNGDVVHLPR